VKCATFFYEGLGFVTQCDRGEAQNHAFLVGMLQTQHIWLRSVCRGVADTRVVKDYRWNVKEIPRDIV